MRGLRSPARFSVGDDIARGLTRRPSWVRMTGGFLQAGVPGRPLPAHAGLTRLQCTHERLWHYVLRRHLVRGIRNGSIA